MRLLAFLAIAFLFRKAFCSWLCPVGTISEYLWRAGKKIFHRSFFLPRWLDLPLRGLKYSLLGFFLWAISTMSAVGIRDFMTTPYGLIADVKMLNFFRHIGETGLVVIGLFVLASVLVPNLWCRFLCPYGALLGLTSWFSPMKIRRDPEPCIDCAKCAKACPSNLPVDKLVKIQSVECTGCMECVVVCPADGALGMRLAQMLTPKKARLAMPGWAIAAGIAVLLLGVAGLAKATGHSGHHLSTVSAPRRPSGTSDAVILKFNCRRQNYERRGYRHGRKNRSRGTIAAAGLLQYQGGAVVSRTLLKHPTASVTAFAFDTGQVSANTLRRATRWS